MNKTKVYLDTSVISYLEQEDSPEKMQITRNVWELLKKGEYDIYVSEVVISELNKCKDDKKRNLLLNHLTEINYTYVPVVNDINDLARQLIDRGYMKEKSIDDCKHIATAMMYGCEFIMSWNFKHIVKLRTINGVREIALENGRKNVQIYSPRSFEEEM